MIARKGKVFFEHYCHDRTSKMRFQSWSMAKSVTSLLLGICIDRGLIQSLDDTVQKYLPELEGTLHGGITLRHLGNMSSGAAIEHASEDYAKLYPLCFTAPSGSDISPCVAVTRFRPTPALGRVMLCINFVCNFSLGVERTGKRSRRGAGRSV